MALLVHVDDVLLYSPVRVVIMGRLVAMLAHVRHGREDAHAHGATGSAVRRRAVRGSWRGDDAV